MTYLPVYFRFFFLVHLIGLEKQEFFMKFLFPLIILGSWKWHNIKKHISPSIISLTKICRCDWLYIRHFTSILNLYFWKQTYDKPQKGNSIWMSKLIKYDCLTSNYRNTCLITLLISNISDKFCMCFLCYPMINNLELY